MTETRLTTDDMIENFALFDDWEERYRYLIDLGRDLPHMEDTLKTDEHIVRGCTSRVWLIPQDNNGTLTFQADSDAHIVRGLIALLMSAYQGKTYAEIRAVNINDFFESLGLDQHLSANRRSGFFAMVERIQSLAS